MLGPIFLREWVTLPRRPRHYVLRTCYLGALWILALTAWQATVGWDRPATLRDNAGFGRLLFELLTYYVQLPLVLFFAALSTAGAIAQEKDRRTFVLLLLTDLRDHEIVLGKLIGSLLPIAVLLLATVPLLALTLLLGGIAPAQLAEATLVMAAAALAAGSLGSLVALWRDQTFQSLALTVLFLVLYLCLVRALPVLAGWLPGSAGFWQLSLGQTAPAWLDPFQALESVLVGLDGHVSSSPAIGFAGTMVLLSVVLNTWAIRRLRYWNPGGEPVVQREPSAEPSESLQAQRRAHAAPGRVRPVWDNPILWREIRTRAYGVRPLLVKAAYLLVLGLLTSHALAPLWTADRAAPFLFAVAADGLVPVSILSLLLICAQAVTAITSERDRGALDLLLVTELTPREFIFGKLGGIAYNGKEYLLPPLLLAGVYAAAGLLATPARGHPEMRAVRNLEALVCVAAALLLLYAFVAVLGMHIALHTTRSGLAISTALGTVFFLSAGTLICVGLILINQDHFENQWTSFILFLTAGTAGLWWVLSADRPSWALTLASMLCPTAVYYAVFSILVGRPGSDESANPLIPFLVLATAFGLAVLAMLVPLLSEFDVALGRTDSGE